MQFEALALVAQLSNALLVELGRLNWAFCSCTLHILHVWHNWHLQLKHYLAVKCMAGRQADM